MVKIEEIGCYHVSVSDKTVWTFVEVGCSDGVTGIGEASKNGRSDEIAGQVARLEQELVGKDALPACVPVETDRSTDLPRRAAISAVEQGLWDALGKRLGASVCELMGGRRRDRIDLYANINRGTVQRNPDGFAGRAEIAAAAGFSAVKLAPFDSLTPDSPTGEADEAFEHGLDCLAAVREAVGPHIDVMVDCHGRLTPDRAEALLQLGKTISLSWVEAPLPETPAFLTALERLRPVAQACGVRLAGMENGLRLTQFLPYMNGGLLDVINPDVKYVGGLKTIVIVAHAAHASGIATALHNPTGPVCHAASLAASAVIPETARLEFQFDETPLFDEMVAGALVVKDGQAVVPDGPGLGIDVCWPERAPE